MSRAPVSTATAEHYTWGSGCDGWYLVRTPELHVIEERMPPGSFEAPHFHGRARQFFYVLEGTLTVAVDGSDTVLQAGEGLEIAPGERHQVFNRGCGDVRFLVTSQPPSQADRVNC